MPRGESGEHAFLAVGSVLAYVVGVAERGLATCLGVLLLVFAEHGDDVDLGRGERLDLTGPLATVRVGPGV